MLADRLRVEEVFAEADGYTIFLADDRERDELVLGVVVISEEALDEAFEEVDEESLIDRAIEKRIRTHGRPENRNDAKRMFDYLARLGFGYDLIRRKLQALRAEIEDNE